MKNLLQYIQRKIFKRIQNFVVLVQASIYIHFGYYSYRCPREITKTLYWDDKGFYTYAKQKVPFYYWKPQNIEEDYKNWTKDKNGYHIPLNEPRKLKKNVFL